MLILSRKKEEKIVIDDKVSIQVLGVYGGTVKLGISAPRDMGIYRWELYQKIQDNKCENHKGRGENEEY